MATRGDRPQRRAGGRGDSGSSSRILASTSSSSRASTRSHIVAARDREDGRGLAELFSRSKAPASPPSWRAARPCPRATAQGLSERRRRAHGRELRRRRDRLPLSRHERGQRQPRDVAAAGARRRPRHGASRADLADLAPLLQLLARSATGQRLTTYTTLSPGRAGEGEADGPEELHVVVLDNGRSDLRGTRYEEMLACIRCGACLNVCPVYRKAGGAAYGQVYSGPMGAVLVPLLVGLDARAGPSARVVALRRVHRGVSGQDPTPRVVARASQGPRRRAGRVPPRTPWLHALVAGLVAPLPVPGLDLPCPPRSASRRTRSGRAVFGHEIETCRHFARRRFRDLR